MGITYKSLTVSASKKASLTAEINFLIDSGAVYSLVPGKELDRIGIEPHRTMEFVLADGTKISRKVGDAFYSFQGEGGAAPVIFGEEGDEPLLGATALESLGLVLNPFKRELYPMRMMLV